MDWLLLLTYIGIIILYFLRVLQSKQVLSESHFKHFLFQLLCGVKYLHENRIIHRDLKPGKFSQIVTKYLIDLRTLQHYCSWKDHCHCNHRLQFYHHCEKVFYFTVSLKCTAMHLRRYYKRKKFKSHICIFISICSSVFKFVIVTIMLFHSLRSQIRLDSCCRV